MSPEVGPGPWDGELTCRELIGVLADYLDTALPRDAAVRVQSHLDGCDECRAYVATYRRTREVAADVQRVSMPDELKERLRVFLLTELGGPDAPGR